jgi:hypothetical protein
VPFAAFEVLNSDVQNASTKKDIDISTEGGRKDEEIKK